MARLIILILIVTSSNGVFAQNLTFEQMGKNLNPNSLPLVNLTLSDSNWG